MSISQRGERYQFDVLVVGSGLAGLSYILELNTLNPHARVALITKKNLMDSNTRYAQGGIASVASSEDSFAAHIEDTLKAGDGLCDPNTVRTVIESAPDSMAFLQKNGVVFDHNAQGQFDLGQEGGHRYRRIYHAGDETGKGISEALIARVHALPQVTVFANHMAVNLITQVARHKPGARREAMGVYVFNEARNQVDTFLAKIVVLATGGAGKVYRYTSNPDVATGDGVALAYRAGARVGHLEFYQFHPTLLYHPTLNNLLISETLRGEGAYLRTVDTEERFMQHYAPEQMEMATRDVVARAIFNELERSAQKFVYLDIRHRDKAFLERRFPTIYQALLSVGIDMSTHMIPVVPGAHYCCGGVLSDIAGHTDILNLFAIGETAFTGLHGANRLASNSLLEAVVMGRLAARDSVALMQSTQTLQGEVQDWDSRSVVDTRRASQINAHWRGLRGEMTSYAGIVRTKSGLQVLLNLIATRREMIEEYYWGHVVTRDVLELRNIVQVAELIVRGALARQESRGGHFREDYPRTLPIAEETVFRNSREPRIKKTLHERPSE